MKNGLLIIGILCAIATTILLIIITSIGIVWSVNAIILIGVLGGIGYSILVAGIIDYLVHH